MKKKFLAPEIIVYIFNTENMITASGGTRTLAEDMQNHSVNSDITTISFATLQDKLSKN